MGLRAEHPARSTGAVDWVTISPLRGWRSSPRIAIPACRLLLLTPRRWSGIARHLPIPLPSQWRILRLPGELVNYGFRLCRSAMFDRLRSTQQSFADLPVFGGERPHAPYPVIQTVRRHRWPGLVDHRLFHSDYGCWGLRGLFHGGVLVQCGWDVLRGRSARFSWGVCPAVDLNNLHKLDKRGIGQRLNIDLDKHGGEQSTPRLLWSD